jgi:hypothetical protein
MKRPNGDGWIVCLGRLRFAWVSPSEWVKKEFPITKWFWVSEFYRTFGVPNVKKVWQMTILGLQVGFMYKGYPDKLK